MTRLATAAAVTIASLLLLGCGHDPLPEFERLSSAETGYYSSVIEPPPEGQVVLGDESTLNDVVAYAAQNSPGLVASFNRYKAAMEQIPQARSLPDPRFLYRYWIVEPMMLDGSVRNVFELSQEFPWFEKLILRGDVAAREAQAAFKKFQAEKLALRARVVEAYFEYYYLHQSQAINDESLRQLSSVEGIVSARSATGGAQADLLRTQVEIARLRNEVETIRDMLPPAQAKLNALLNRPTDAPLPRPQVARFERMDVDAAGLAALLAAHNPELAGMGVEIQKQAKEIELAKKEYLPDIMLGFEYDQMVPNAGSDENPNDQKALMASLNIPIWHEKYAAGVRQARYRYLAAVADKLQKTNDLSVELKEAIFSLRNAQRKIDLYGQSLLPRARQTLSSVRSTYQTGGGDFADMIESHRVLLDFELSVRRAEADRHIAMARIESLVGLPRRHWTPQQQQPASAPATAPATAPSAR